MYFLRTYPFIFFYSQEIVIFKISSRYTILNYNSSFYAISSRYTIRYYLQFVFFIVESTLRSGHF